MLPGLEILVPSVGSRGIVAQAVEWAAKHGYETTAESVHVGSTECIFSDTTEWLEVDHPAVAAAMGWTPVAVLAVHSNAKNSIAQKILAELSVRLAEDFSGVISLDNVLEDLDPTDVFLSTPGLTGTRTDCYASPSALAAWIKHPEFHVPC